MGAGLAATCGSGFPDSAIGGSAYIMSAVVDGVGSGNATAINFSIVGHGSATETGCLATW